MTDKDIFERVKAHLLQQKVAARVDDRRTSSCAYRGKGGLKCAIGCLIPDEAYTPVIEGCGIAAVIPAGGKWYRDNSEPLAMVKNAPFLAEVLNKSGIPARQSTKTLLERLQLIHDTHDPVSWSRVFEAEANQFDAEGMYHE